MKEVRNIIQEELDNLEVWNNRNRMKASNTDCKDIQLGNNNKYCCNKLVLVSWKQQRKKACIYLMITR